jgi:hypothetical protein
MKFRFWMMGLAAFLALGIAAAGTTYYVDDNSNDGDVYTPDFTGNDANDGLTPSTPKLTLNNLLASTNLLPGDAVLIDTGTYTNNVVIGTNVNGTEGNRIVFRGSTSTAGNLTELKSGAGSVLEVRGNYLKFSNLLIVGGTVGISPINSSYCEYESLSVISNFTASLLFSGYANSNVVKRSAFHNLSMEGASAMFANAPAKDNYIEHCVAVSPGGVAFGNNFGGFSFLVNSIGVGRRSLSRVPPLNGRNNIFYFTEILSASYENLADLQAFNTNWVGNTVADPKFANAEGFDFHLLSAAGFVSNGVWVTNAAVGYSPGIDFGARE